MHTISVSHYMPQDHGTHADFIQPWARAVEAECNGQLRVLVHSGESELGVLANQHAQVAGGAVDVAHSPGHLPPGRFPRLAVVGLPFMVGSSAEGTALLWRLFEDGDLEAEFGDFHVLALHCDSGALLHTRDRMVRRVEDLAGLRLRSPNPIVSAALECLGARPVQVPPPEIGAAVAAGRLDGAVMAWDVLAYSGTAEAFRFHLDTKLFCAPLYFVMNRARHAALPAPVQAGIARVSGAVLARKFPEWWAKWEAVGAALGQAPGHTITRLEPREIGRWRERVRPAIDAAVAALAGEAPDVKSIHAKANALLRAAAS